MSFQSFFTGNQSLGSKGSSFLIGRVTKVILGPYLADGQTPDPDYNDPTDIGKIKYTIHNSKQQYAVMADGNPTASPAWSFFKYIPVVDEFVYIVVGPGTDLNETAGNQSYYYLPSFGLWGATNHNAFRDLLKYSTLSDTYRTTLQDNVAGIPNSQVPPILSMSFGNNFVEKDNVRGLQPFVGDFILEGRWGNSIRFGSSITANEVDNNWSNSKEEGDPILLIRNGQGNVTDKTPWNPITEDINRDASSIYLTAGQKIIINDIQANFSLSSFNVVLALQRSQVKTIATIPTSNEYISPNTADQLIKDATSPTLKTQGSGSFLSSEQQKKASNGSYNLTPDQTITSSSITIRTLDITTTFTQSESRSLSEPAQQLVSLLATQSAIQPLPPVNIQSPQPISTTTIQKLTVVGDKYSYGGTSVVTLRALSPSGDIAISVTGTADRLQTAYIQAVSSLKARGLPKDVKIPLLNQLQRL